VTSFLFHTDIVPDLVPAAETGALPPPPQTPVLTEVIHDSNKQQKQQSKQKEQNQPPASAVIKSTSKPLSIREATARAIEKHMEKVANPLFCG
jgi:type IV secretory pathway VirB10-like protein